MQQTNISNNKNELPLWDLSEIYKDIKDPMIKNDLKDIKNLSKEFLKKWKGKIKNLNSTEKKISFDLCKYS